MRIPSMRFRARLVTRLVLRSRLHVRLVIVEVLQELVILNHAVAVCVGLAITHACMSFDPALVRMLPPTRQTSTREVFR